MDRTPGWRDVLALWCKLQHPQWIAGWLGDLEHVQREGGKSRHGAAIREVLVRSLDGRVEYVPVYQVVAEVAQPRGVARGGGLMVIRRRDNQGNSHISSIAGLLTEHLHAHR
jgi:hypothetical protein